MVSDRNRNAGMARREFLSIAGAGAAAVLTRGLWAEEAGGKRPSLIIILADDMGYADIGVQGCKDIPTPNIDALARGGVRCTSGYVSCPVCSPTRAGLMTGRYQQRFGHWYNPGPPTAENANFGLPLDEVTIANVLKGGGYATGLVGKWHLGLKPEYHPMQRGFDEFFGFLHGSHSYTDPLGDKANPVMRGTEPVDETEYLTDAFNREAADFIERHHEHPFFLYLSYNAVHSPMQAPQKYLERFAGIADQQRRTYAAMLSALDDGVGAVMGKLREHGLDENTLVVFLSDNGGPTTVNGSDNTPLRGIKGTVFEGGSRVPFLLHWPAALPKGAVYDQPVIALDLLPTFAAAGGAAIPEGRKLDGVDLLPYLGGAKSGAPHERLFWAATNGKAVRQGKWKLVCVKGEPTRLFDLEADVGEQKDVIADNPDTAKALQQTLDAWAAELKAPLWEPTVRNPQRRQKRRANVD